MDADLYRAAIEGDVRGIEKLSEKIDQVTEKDGCTILHLASWMGKTECVRFILTQVANKELLIKIDKYGRTALHNAALRGDTDAVELLINAARDSLPSSEYEKFIRRADMYGDTALHHAVYKNKVDAVKLLVNADPNHKHSVNVFSMTPLCIAVERDYKDIVKVICESCTSPTFDAPYGTVLHTAIDKPNTGEIDAVELLEFLINGARRFLPSSEFEKFIRQADEDGDTALHLAVYKNKVEAVKLLVKADPNHKHSLNKRSRSPLYMAAENGYSDIVKVICESCATPTFDGPDGRTTFDGPHGRTALHAAIESPNTVKLLINWAARFLQYYKFKKFIGQPDDYGDTALHRAVYENEVEAVKLLVKADRYHKHSLNSRSETPLYIAAHKGYKDIVKVICESCTSPTFDGPCGRTALHAAIGSPNTVELLINAAKCLSPSSEFEKFIRRADDINCDTALHLAVRNNNVETVKLLAKADPNHKHSLNKMSKSPLYIAVEEGYKDIVKVICESCTSPTFDGPHDKTALHVAIKNRDTVELLINAAKGLSPSSEFEKFIRRADDINGDTALHLAVRNNNVETVKLLAKADPNHKHSLNKMSKSPLYIAVEQGYKDIVKVICESCATPSFDGPNGKTALHAAIESPNTEDDAVELINVTRGLFPSSEFEKFIRHADDNGDTALHVAVERNQVELVKLLLEVDPTHEYSKSRSGTPHYIAVKQGYKDIIELISTSCTTTAFDGPQGKTSLHAAAENGDKDSVRFILDKREDLILKRDDIGWTAVDYAASKNFRSILDILIETEENQFHYYSDYEQFFMDRPFKETAIHRAAFEGHISTVVQLMKLYPDFFWSAVNEHGQNILHIAVDRSHKELVKAILKCCPNLSQILNSKDKNGNTPLHVLFMRGCFILELIRHEGVDRDAKNNDDLTPYDMLYLDQEIVADQLKIKVALKDSEFINQRWNIRLRRSNPEPITAKLSVDPSSLDPSTCHTKEAKFKKESNLLRKEEIKLYRARINTQIIVTALITTVTFTVGFTMPGGYHQEEGKSNQGSAVLSKETAFIVFVLADTLALLLSMSSLALYFVASMYQDAEVVAKLVDASTVLNIISVVATMLTFIMAICLVLPHSSVLLIAVGVMSGFFLLLIILLLIMVVKDPVEKFRDCEEIVIV